MITSILFHLLWLFGPLALQSEKPSGPEQPNCGPGGTDYLHAEVRFSDFADEMDGYWLFEPAAPVASTAPVVVFNHGYGAINPMIYGAWIRHLVRRGNIVVYPRYQRSLLAPSSKKFVGNAAKGIRAALHRLKTEEGRVRPDTNAFFLAGHSYGGAIAANMAARHRALELPQPKGVLLCAPGTGPLKGGLLEDYSGIDSAIRLAVIVSVHDHVVGEDFGHKVFETAVNARSRFLIRQHPDEYGQPALGAGHNECYALDDAFDGGVSNLSLRRAKQVGEENAIDYYGYWKTLDALMACALRGEHCELAEGKGLQAAHMGEWSDGQPVQPLEVLMP